MQRTGQSCEGIEKSNSRFCSRRQTVRIMKGLALTKGDGAFAQKTGIRTGEESFIRREKGKDPGLDSQEGLGFLWRKGKGASPEGRMRSQN